MLFNDFCSTIQKDIQEKMGDNCSVQIHPVNKNNNHILHGLTIHENDCNIAPTIYLDYYYEDLLSGKSIQTIEQEIIEVYQRNKSAESMDLSFFTDYAKVKHHVVYKLIHYEQNKELLKNVPHIQYLDLA